MLTAIGVQEEGMEDIRMEVLEAVEEVQPHLVEAARKVLVDHLVLHVPIRVPLE